MKAWILAALLLAAPLLTYGEVFKYTELQILDFEDMDKDIRKRIEMASQHMGAEASVYESQKAVEILREATRKILSRPDPDNVVSKILPLVSGPLRRLNAYDDTMASIARQAITALKDNIGTPEMQATNIYILRNLLGQLKPTIENNSEAKDIYMRIYKAELKTPKLARKHIMDRAIYKKPQSPSEIAKLVLQQKGLIKK